jgi:FAD/FMN-containing dehydrogenase
MTATRSIPLSALELSAAVRAALPYDAARLDRVLRVDERYGLVEVQAATEWKTIAAALRPGDARAVAAARTAMRTVGESIAANTAGPDGRPAISHVESITLVTPGGELRRLSRTTHRELFALVVGGQGLFGALYSVTLDIGSLSRAVDEAVATEPPIQGARLLVPPEALDAFLADARKRCDEWRLPLQGVQVRRTLEDKDSFLRWAQREYAAVTLQLPEPRELGAAVRATQLRHELLDAAIARGGSFPVWCISHATRAQVEACYPQLPAFLAEKRRVDPDEKLTNAWYRHYRGLLSGEKCEVRWAN